MTPPTTSGQQGAGMNPDEFFRLVRMLANSCWVRYYMMERPGEFVLEIGQPAHETQRDSLEGELAPMGFVRLSNNHYSGWMLRRWAVKRSDWEPR